MHHLFSSRVAYASIFFVLLTGLIYVCKPSLFFDEDACIRPFGISSYEATMFPLGIGIIVLSFMCFYLFAMLDFMFEKK